MKYRTRPDLVIEARELTEENYWEIVQWIGESHPEILTLTQMGDTLTIPTPEGAHEAHIGDFIIKGLIGEFYPCKPEVFRAKYEAID